MIGIFNNLIIKATRRLKEKDGMTLVEVVIAFLIIAIVSTVLVRGTIVAVNTMRINKSKTIALAIANEKIEIIKAIDYSDILITEVDGSNPWIVGYQPELSELEDEYDISYNVTWVAGDSDGYKQLKVSVSGGYINVPIDVVTQLYPPVGEEATIGNIYPPPGNLKLDSDNGEPREVRISWDAPVTDKNVLGYYIYRDSEFPDINPKESSPSFTYFYDSPGDDSEYTYYVTVVYEGGTESVKSNSITTGTPFVYPAIVNLTIEVSGGGPTRTAYLAWEAPDTELIIMEFQIYREDLELPIGNTQELTFDYIIEAENYTFYIKTLYENDNLSGPSILVTSN